MEFDWDQNKNQINQDKHGLSFEEASSLFSIQKHQVLELFDYEHSIDEDRLLSIGPIERGIIVVVSTEREDDTIRIISARFATKSEVSIYYREIHGETHE